MSDETYDEARARNLEAMLRALAERIRHLDAQGTLRQHSAELQKLLGDVRSELFHYEVHATYDTPEVAEHKRIVAEATDTHEETWQNKPWTPDEDGEKGTTGDDPTW
jgi:hypothetical protein